ncbi:C3H1-type domain-containing protein [Haematococcus lacustris]|uniref:C3H1-type domain-containing protein n=1 Tax=Haematococcus lacustris TaxID=44745 RepID=A0A6A0A116_HAELA|nr:C3H1-type domain-containing protein [Haematococcus lacustris]
MGSWETWQLRPARRQVDEATLQRDTQLKKANELPRNAWSGKVHRQLTGEEKGAQRHDRVKERSRFRCMPEVDCGRTKGSQAQQKMFCLYFAKGCCSQGVNCLYLHRLPTQEDEAYHCKDMGADIFGREKRAEHEGFHKGAGTIERDNRCLYVNYEGAGAYEVPKIRELLEANFGQWGPIKNIYIKHVTTIAFVKYEWRSSAEFAKEAMHKQGLLGSSQCAGPTRTPTQWPSCATSGSTGIASKSPPHPPHPGPEPRPAPHPPSPHLPLPLESCLANSWWCHTAL